MDPVHNPLPMVRLGKIEEMLQCQEAFMASAALEARRTAEANGQALFTLAGQLQQLPARLDLTSLPAAPVPGVASSYPSSDSRVGTPECFAGDPEMCRAFITNCSPHLHNKGCLCHHTPLQLCSAMGKRGFWLTDASLFFIPGVRCARCLFRAAPDLPWQVNCWPLP